MRPATFALLLLIAAAPAVAGCKQQAPEEAAEAQIARTFPAAKGHFGDLGATDRKLLQLIASPALVHREVAGACKTKPQDELVTAKLLLVDREESRGVPASVVCNGGDFTAAPDAEWKGALDSACGGLVPSCETAKSLAKAGAWSALDQSVRDHVGVTVAFLNTYRRPGSHPG